MLAVTFAIAAVGLFDSGAAAAARSPRFRRLVAVGDSLFAGFGSGGLSAHGAVPQRFAAPKLIARQARARLPLPLMDGPGVPPPYRIVDQNGDGRLDAGEVQRGTGIGFRDDPERVVRNLAVPGESVLSIEQTVDLAEVAGDAVGGDVEGRDVMKALILGLPPDSDEASQLTQARALRPTFVMLWIGNNDYLGLTSATDTPVPDAATFGAAYRRVLRQLTAQGADAAVANLPDATRSAALRRAAGEVTACRRADGTQREVAADDLLPVSLSRDQLPVPPCNRVLDAADRERIRALLAAANAEIAAAVAEVGAARGRPIALVDVAARFEEIATAGVDVRGDGSLVVDASYLGGVFSLDGQHPTRTGQALVANAFIEAINRTFGEQLPAVNVAAIAARDPLVNSAYRPSGEPPFGLFIEEDLGDAVTRALDSVGDDAQDLGEDLEEELSDLLPF